MNCPDIERLLDRTRGTLDPETEEHLRTCSDCRTMRRIIVESRAAWEPEMEVPETLVAATVEALVAASVMGQRGAAAAADTQPRVSPWDAAKTGLLAATTVLIATLATESAPLLAGAASLGAGLFAGSREAQGRPLSV